jgi:hypothetical protein
LEYDFMFGYYVVGGVAIVILVALATVRSSLMNSTWSLADALSEEADITPLDASGKPYTGPDGKALITSELRASSSRFIALIGLIGILLLYLGFGLEVLFRFGNGDPVPADTINTIEQMLLYGAIMFAPYIANKFSSVFDWLKPSK